jgi:hypothetical protein
MATWTYSQTTPRLLALSSAIAGDAVTDLIESAKFFDVDMDHLARLFALIAAYRLGRLQCR